MKRPHRTRVAVAGDTVVVSAPREQSSAAGVDGDQGDDSLTSAGAAYVFERSGATWSQQAYLKAQFPESSATFGSALDLSADTIACGAPLESAAGAAYVFARSGTTWTMQSRLEPAVLGSGDRFGTAVVLDGDRLAVGATLDDGSSGLVPDAGAVYLFARSGAAWGPPVLARAAIANAGDGFGSSAAIFDDALVVGAWFEDSSATGQNGNALDNGATDAGAVYTFSVACGSAAAYGEGCAGSGGFVPRLAIAGCAAGGETVTVAIDNGLGGSQAFLFVGSAPAVTPVGGCTFLIQAPFGVVAPLPLSGAAPGEGAFAFDALLPPLPPGTTGRFQAWVLDPAKGTGAAGSNGVHLVVD